jgi:hypothetical protein
MISATTRCQAASGIGVCESVIDRLAAFRFTSARTIPASDPA